MKILHIIASADPRHGGPIDSIKTLSAAWRNGGHRSDVLTLDAAGEPWLGDPSLHAIPVGSRFYRGLPLGGYGYSPGLVGWLRRHARDYDVLIVHGLWNYASLGTWRAVRKRGTPYFVFVHGMLDPYFRIAQPLKGWCKALFWRALEHRVLRDAAGALFTAHAERQLAQASFRPYLARPFVVGLGTRDPEDGHAAQQVGAFLRRVPAAKGRRFLLFLGRIHPKKGIDLLIRGFSAHAARHPAIDLVIAGPDQEQLTPALQALAAGLDIGQRVHWPGMLTGDAKWGAFRACDFFALTSHQENFGIAVAEALAVGAPVLITDKVNIWHEIEEDGAGLVMHDTRDDVLRCLGDALSLDPERRRDMGRQARACFERRYDIESVARGLLDVFERELSGGVVL